MTPEHLDAIRARADAATEGTWETRGYEQMPGKYVVGPRKAGDLGRGPVILMQPLFCDERSAANAEFIAHAREDVPALLAELERTRRGAQTLGRVIEQQGRDVLDATGLHDWIDEDGDGDWGAVWENLYELRPALKRAEADRDDLEERLSLLLWELTGGRLSKPGYDVRTMVSEIEATFERYAEMDRAELQADRDRLAATVRRVRELLALDDDPWIHQDDIRAAIEGTDS